MEKLRIAAHAVCSICVLIYTYLGGRGGGVTKLMVKEEKN